MIKHKFVIVARITKNPHHHATDIYREKCMYVCLCVFVSYTAMVLAWSCCRFSSGPTIRELGNIERCWFQNRCTCCSWYTTYKCTHTHTHMSICCVQTEHAVLFMNTTVTKQSKQCNVWTVHAVMCSSTLYSVVYEKCCMCSGTVVCMCSGVCMCCVRSVSVVYEQCTHCCVWTIAGVCMGSSVLSVAQEIPQ